MIFPLLDDTYERYGDGQRNNGGIDRAQPTICACCVSRRFLMRGPTRGSRDGKVGCAKRSSGGKNSSSRIRIDLRFPPFLLKFPSLKKKHAKFGGGEPSRPRGGGKKRHRIDETRQVTNNNLGRGERDPPLFLPFVSKISRTMDAPPPPPLW